jgi:hypothetical protein
LSSCNANLALLRLAFLTRLGGGRRLAGRCHGSGLSSRGCPTFAPARPDFLLRSTSQDRVCGFLQGRPHAVRQRHQPRQEIRGSGTKKTGEAQPSFFVSRSECGCALLGKQWKQILIVPGALERGAPSASLKSRVGRYGGWPPTRLATVNAPCSADTSRKLRCYTSIAWENAMQRTAQCRGSRLRDGSGIE